MGPFNPQYGLGWALEPGPKRYNHHSGNFNHSYTIIKCTNFGHISQQYIQSNHMDFQLHMKPTNLYASGGFLEETVSPEVIQYTQHDCSGVGFNKDMFIILKKDSYIC